MIKYRIIEPEDLLILEPDAPLEAADFEFLEYHLDPYLAKYGKLPGLMVHAKKFPGWADVAAFTAHMRFVKDHIKKVMRFAMVSDSLVLTDVSKIADHLVDAEVKHFPDSSYARALQWLKDGVDVTTMRGKVA